MVDFVAPLGLRTSNGELWNIDIFNDQSSVLFGNLRLSANALSDGNKFLEIDNENGHISIGMNVSPLASSKLRVDFLEEPNGTAINANALNIGIFGTANNIGGLFAGSNRAGVFVGDVEINGELILTSSLISVDNPLDPENESLNHASISSSEMINVYSGNVILDENGEALVELAEWVEAFNKDFRYQLTCIGGYSSVYIAEEFSGNSFRIAGGNSNTKISWQLTGVRKDPWAQTHPLVVKQEKLTTKKGYYQHPDLYDQPGEKSTVFAEYPEVIQQLNKANKLSLANKI